MTSDKKTTHVSSSHRQLQSKGANNSGDSTFAAAASPA